MPDATDTSARAARIGAVVGGVVAQAVRDAGASGIVVVDDGSPEARLALGWCAERLGADAVVSVTPPAPERALAWIRDHAPGDRADGGPRGTTDEAALLTEAHRFLARTTARRRGAIVAHPVNKTALLLDEPPPDPLLPLGDLYAAQVKALTGDWTVPAPVRRWAERSGGIEVLDRALERFIDRRHPTGDAFAAVPNDVATETVRAFKAGRFARRRLGLVPKLAARTAGIDLFA